MISPDAHCVASVALRGARALFGALVLWRDYTPPCSPRPSWLLDTQNGINVPRSIHHSAISVMHLS